MDRLSKIIPIMVVFSLLFPISSAFSGIYDQLSIKGYVLFTKKEFGNEYPKFRAANETEIYKILLEYPSGRSVDVQTNNGKTAVKTDRDGFFEMEISRWFFQKKQIALSISGSSSQIDIPLSLSDTKSLFLVILMSNQGADVYFKEDKEISKKLPVVLTTVELFPFLAKGSSKWRPILDFLKEEGVGNNFQFFEVKLIGMSDFRESISLLNRRLLLIERLTNETSVIAIGYSLGALALRYYSISLLYKDGSIQSILQIAPPNKGLKIPTLVTNIIGKKRGKIVRQVEKGSVFIDLMNQPNMLTEEYCEYYHLAPAKMNEKGFNASIKTEIIAGEIMKSKKNSLRKIGEKVTDEIEEIISYWARVFNESGVNTDLFQKLSKCVENTKDSYQVFVNNLSEGDLIVPLKSAILPNLPYSIIDYNHFNLLVPSGVNDQRYLNVKDFLVEQNNIKLST